MHHPHILFALLLMSPLTTYTNNTDTDTAKDVSAHYKTTTPEDKAATQAAAAGFLGLAENIITIIQNSDDPKAVGSGAHGIVTSFLNIIAATKRTKTPTNALEIEFLEKLHEAIDAHLALKKGKQSYN